MDKISKRAGFILGGMTVLAGAGAVYQVIATARDKRKYPAPGQMVDVNGFRLHLHCTGKGSPTVVIDNGLGNFSPDWHLVQAEVAKFTRVCTYDRAGYGWSDPGPPPRTGRQIVKELHTLLVNADIEGPYVLVGYSLGGMTACLYAYQYPDEVVGAVFVESAHKDMLSRLPQAFRRAFAIVTRMRLPIAVLSRLGVIRLVMQLRPPAVLQYYIQKLPRDVQPLALVPRFWSQYSDAAFSEIAGVEESIVQLRATDSGDALLLDDKPLVVLTGSVEKSAMEWCHLLLDFPVEQYKRGWMDLQTDLAGLSSNSTHVISEKSGHGIIIEHPESVVDAIRQVVETVRGK